MVRSIYSQDNYELKKYRGVFCAVWSESGQTKSKSMRTDDPVLAKQRFLDWLQPLSGETIAEIYDQYVQAKSHTASADRIKFA